MSEMRNSLPRSVIFTSRVEAAAKACNEGDFEKALRLYDDAVRIDPTNNVLFSNRAVILCKLGRFSDALEDADRALTLKPGWAKAYFRKGHAYNCIGDHVRALVAYATGLSQDPSSAQLLTALVDCANGSTLKERFSAVYNELVGLRLESSPFVVISVIGQELLAAGFTQEAVQVLESAVHIDTTSLKLKQSVLSSLSSAYWKLDDHKRAAQFMVQDMTVAAALGDMEGESRAHANLGMLHLADEDVVTALKHYRQQLALELSMGNDKTASSILSIIGQLYLQIGDYANSLASYQHCMEILPANDQIDPIKMAVQIEGMGDVYFAKNDLNAALDSFRRFRQISQSNGRPDQEARAICSMGRVLMEQGNHAEGSAALEHALNLARDVKDRPLEGQVIGQLSLLCQLRGQWERAKSWAEKQLQLALRLGDKRLESEACGHLGSFYRSKNDPVSGRRLYEKQLELSILVGDKSSARLAHRNLGLCMVSLSDFDGALISHKTELELSTKLGDQLAQSEAHGNLAVVYELMNNTSQQFLHLQCQWQLANNTANMQNQSRALSALGHFHSNVGDYQSAVHFLEKSLMLAQEQTNVNKERRICARLGRAHMAIKKYREAARYFEQELTIAKDERDQDALASAYEHLGEARLKLGRLDEAFDCHKYQLALAHIASNASAKLAALEKIGAILIQRRDMTAAMTLYTKCLKLVKSCADHKTEARVYGKLGDCNRIIGKSEMALTCYLEELAVYSALNDERGKVVAFGHLAEHHRRERDSDLSLQMSANRVHSAQLLQDSVLEAKAHMQMGAICQSFSLFTDAISSFDQSLHLLDHHSLIQLELVSSTLLRIAHCNGRLGQFSSAADACFRCLQLDDRPSNTSEQVHRRLGSLLLLMDRHSDSILHFETALQLATSKDVQSIPEVITASYRGLAAALVRAQNLDRAVIVLTDRMHFCDQIGSTNDKLRALCDLASVYRLQDRSELAIETVEIGGQLADRAANSLMLVEVYDHLCKLLEYGHDFDQLTKVVDRLNRLARSSIGSESVDLNLSARLASGRLNMLSENWLNAVADFDQASGLAVSLLKSEIEIDIRLCQAALSIVLSRNMACDQEMEQISRMNTAVFSHATELIDIILETGHCFSRCKLSCLLQLISCNFDSLRALVAAERYSFFTVQELSVRKMLKPGLKNHLPMMSNISNSLTVFQAMRKTLLYQFSIEDFLLVWILPPDGEVHFCIEKTNSNVTVRLETNSEPLKRTILCALEKLYSQSDPNVIASKLEPLSENQLIYVGCFSYLTGRAPRLCNLYQFELHASYDQKMVETCISSMILMTTFSDSEEPLARILNTRPLLLDDKEMPPELLLTKMASSRIVHLQLPIDGTGIVLPDNEDGSTSHIKFDSIASTPMLTQVVLIIGCSDESNRHHLARMFLLAGAQSILFLQSTDNLEFCLTFYEQLLNKDAPLLTAIEQFRSLDKDLIVYGMPKNGCRKRSFGMALKQLLNTPDECRVAMRVLLHLIEKSLQRINTGKNSAMYTRESGVRSRVGPEVRGWLDILKAVGFERKLENNDPCLHFPDANCFELLTAGSAVLIALIGLPQSSLAALSQLCSLEGLTDPIIQLMAMLDTVLAKKHFEAIISTVLYCHPGVSRLLSSLGFDKLKESNGEVFVKSIRLELTDKQCQLALTAMKCIFKDLVNVDTPKKQISRSKELVSARYSPFTCTSTNKMNENSDINRRIRAKHRKGRRKNCRPNGYWSENEIRTIRKKLAYDQCQSDDDGTRRRSSDDEEVMSDCSRSLLLEVTATVLSVDERASPLNFNDSDHSRTNCCTSWRDPCPSPPSCDLLLDRSPDADMFRLVSSRLIPSVARITHCY